MIATGRDATVGQSTVVWKNQQVWNNDGDTAFLVTPEDPFYLSRAVNGP